MEDLEEGVLEVLDEERSSFGREKGSEKSTDGLYQCNILRKGTNNNKIMQNDEFRR